MKISAKLLMFPAALLFLAGVGVIGVFGGVRLLDLFEAIFVYSHSSADVVFAFRGIGPDIVAVLLCGLALVVPGAICLAAGISVRRFSGKKAALLAE